MDNQNITYPHVSVDLVGEDGNAFAIIGRVTKAMRRAGVDKSDIDTFRGECMACDSYELLLAHVMETVDAR